MAYRNDGRITATGRIRLGDTPPSHWTANRKADLLAYIAEGRLSREEALSRYGLTEEELVSMERRAAQFGVDGLALQKTQTLRPKESRDGR